MSTPALKALLAQQAALAAQISFMKESSKVERAAAIEKCKELIETFGLERTDVFAPVPAPIKYRGPKEGQTWTGRGFAPKWLQEQLDLGVPLATFGVKE